MLLLCMLFACTIQANAASRMKMLKIGRTYSVSLTGTKKQKLKLSYSKRGNYNQALNIYINGKLCRRLDMDSYSWSAALCTVSKNRTLLYIRDTTNNDYNDCMKIFEYKSGRLTELADLCKLTRNATYKSNKMPLSSWARGDLLKVGANSLTVRWCESTSFSGNIYVDVPYKISGKTIKRSASAFAVKQYNGKRPGAWTVSKNFNAYTTAGGKKLSFRAKRGQKATLLTMTRKSGRVYFQVKNSKGKKGWVKVPTTWNGAYFKEALFAG